MYLYASSKLYQLNSEIKTSSLISKVIILDLFFVFKVRDITFFSLLPKANSADYLNKKI